MSISSPFEALAIPVFFSLLFLNYFLNKVRIFFSGGGGGGTSLGEWEHNNNNFQVLKKKQMTMEVRGEGGGRGHRSENGNTTMVPTNQPAQNILPPRQFCSLLG